MTRTPSDPQGAASDGDDRRIEQSRLDAKRVNKKVRKAARQGGEYEVRDG